MTAQAGRPHATAGPVPQDYQDALERARRSLVERVAEGDDQLLERYVTDGDLGREALLEGVRSQTHQCRLLPVVGGSALKQIGVSTLLDAMVTLLPSPIMRARFHPIHGFDLQPESAAISREPLPTEPFSALVFKTLIDPFVGRLSYIRLYSGTLQADSGFYNSTRQVKERGGHLFSILGKKYTVIPAAIAGDIVAVGKLKDSLTGDTLCDEHAPIRYPGISFAKPVVSFAITPKQQAEIEKVSLGLHRLIEEDPSLEFHRNGETKEMVLAEGGNSTSMWRWKNSTASTAPKCRCTRPESPTEKPFGVLRRRRENIRSRRGDMVSTEIAGWKSDRFRAAKGSSSRIRSSVELFPETSFRRWKKVWLNPCGRGRWPAVPSSMCESPCMTGPIMSWIRPSWPSKLPHHWV